MGSAQANERRARVELRVPAVLLALGFASFFGMAWLLEGAASGEPAVPRASTQARHSVKDSDGALAAPQDAHAAQGSPELAQAHAPVPASGGVDPLRDPLARAGEREHYQRFARMAAESSSALEARAPTVLFGAGPDCEKVAFLRALVDSGSAQSGAWLETAVLALPDEPSAAGESVPGFAMQRLAGHAALDPLTRSSLERIAFAAPRRAAERLRRQAATALAQTASPAELVRMAADLAREESALLRSSVLEALSRHPDPDAVAAAFGALPQREGPPPSDQEP